MILSLTPQEKKTMNLNSKQLIALTLGVVVAVPTFIVGFPNQVRAVEQVTNGAVCLRLETATNSIRTKLAENKERWDARKIERSENWTEKTSNLQDRLEQKRLEADDKRDDAIEKLKAEYPDAEQREAIEEFQNTVEKAVTDRRNAFDAAHKAYREVVASLLQKRHDSFKTALATQKAAIDAAIAQAKSDCATGVEASEIRTELANAIKEARAQFQTDRAAVEKIKSQIEALRETRKEAIKEAQDKFNETLADAREALKEVLDSAEDTSDTEESSN
jgi:hypothetical protein